MSWPGRGLVVARRLAGLLGLALAACTAQTPAVAPGGAGGVEATSAEPPHGGPNELPSLQAELDQAWGELRALDDAEALEAASTPDADPRAPADRCERIRGLAERICSIRDRICALADEHPGQPRYAQGCAGAEDTCVQATGAADRCAAA